MSHVHGTTGAEDSTADLAEGDAIVVTGTRHSGDQLMRSVMTTAPRFADLVTGEQADEEQITNLNDFSYKVPGFRPQITTPHYSRMTIRGFGQPPSGAAGIGYQAETNFVVDNVTWLQPDYQWGDWTNISSFEIAYGPAGTDGQHNSEVGQIVITTPLPSFTRRTDYEQTIGNYGRFTEKIDTTGALTDHLAYRVAAYFDYAKGWIYDLLNGHRYQNTDRGGVRAQWLYTNADVTDRFIFSYGQAAEYTQYGAGEGTGGASAPIGDSVLTYANGVYAGSYVATFLQRLGRPVITLNPYHPALGDPGKERSELYTAQNELNYQIGKNTLTAITAWGHFSGINGGTTDNQNVWIGTSGEMDDHGSQVSQEIRLSAPNNNTVAWRVGLYGVYNHAWNHMHHISLGPDAAQWYSNPALIQGLTNFEDNYNTNFQLAAYAHTVIHFTDKLSVTLGVRDSYDTQRFNNNFTVPYVPGSPYTPDQQLQAALSVGFAGNVSTGIQHNQHNGVTAVFNPKYQIGTDSILYVLIGHGDKTVSANGNQGPINVKNITSGRYEFYGWGPFFTKPTNSWDYEAGAKIGLFNGRFISDLNAYWNDLYNYQTPQVYIYTLANGDLASLSYMGNAPHARLYGFQLAESINPAAVPGLSIHGSGAWQRVKFVSYDNAPPPASSAYPGGPKTVDESGQFFPGVPAFTFNIGADYEHSAGYVFKKPVSIFGYANEAWWSRTRLTDPLSVQQFFQGAYSIVNIGIGIRTDDHRLGLTLWVKNLLNALPFTGYSPGSTSAPASVDISSQGPRYFGATLHVGI